MTYRWFTFIRDSFNAYVANNKMVIHVSNNYKTYFQNVDIFPFIQIINYKSEVFTLPEIDIAL